MGDYIIIKKLGWGSFGTAFLAKCKEKGDLVVIKEIFTNDKAKVMEEAEILKKMNHEYIIGFRQAFENSKGNVCIVMDYADGGTIEESIRTAKRLNVYLKEDLILDWFTQI